MNKNIAVVYLSVVTLILCYFVSGPLYINTPSVHDVLDVSWPNCYINPLYHQDTAIVGVNGGLSFRPNKCLKKEVGWFNKISLYVNTGYPGTTLAKKYYSYPKNCALSDESCLAYNYGFNSGLYAIQYAISNRVFSNLWWLDVETSNSWSANVAFNKASLIGIEDAINQRVILPIIGFYSNKHQWNIITGNWQNKQPSWLATGSTSKELAISQCNNTSFTGGAVWLTQYTIGLDKNYVCRSDFNKNLFIFK